MIRKWTLTLFAAFLWTVPVVLFVLGLQGNVRLFFSFSNFKIMLVSDRSVGYLLSIHFVLSLTISKSMFVIHSGQIHFWSNFFWIWIFFSWVGLLFFVFLNFFDWIILKQFFLNWIISVLVVSDLIKFGSIQTVLSFLPSYR